MSKPIHCSAVSCLSRHAPWSTSRKADELFTD